MTYNAAAAACSADGYRLPSGQYNQLPPEVFSNHRQGETWIQVTGLNCPRGCWLDGTPFSNGMYKITGSSETLM